ncbi:MAG: type II toxin-antitoxin system RatA family toxin [Candidatus Competibacteraceae bacterium]|nr:type II toxin-antitoxin system RatA family toxin [Candidatus Competibacteraceae bacterium]
MANVHRSALVPYSAAEMFALVDDIESYPRFLPWCRSSRVLSRNDDEVRATLELAKGGVQKSFTTCNRLQRNKMIEIRLVEGPFHHLEGFWTFRSLEEQACKVSLDMDYEFANGLLSMAIGPIFNQIANSLVEAFCQRAEQIYGRR